MRFVLVLVASAVLWAQPAQAALLYSGAGDSGANGYSLPTISKDNLGRSGRYIVEFTFSTPIENFRFANWVIGGWNSYLTHPPYSYETGNNFEEEEVVSIEGPTQHVSAVMTMPRSYNTWGGGLTTTYYYQPWNANLYFDSIGPVEFTYSSAFQTAVPEPSIWALMIMGFGAIGCAMRRKPNRNLRASPA